MDKIPSFQKNHDVLPVGLHAQTDQNGITTFDLRFKKPNGGDYVSPKALHTIEHLLATVLRNSAEKENIVYFGPMGCRTGFYLLTLRLSYDEVLALLKKCIPQAIALEEIPGSKREECGNYLEHDLNDAKRELKNYLNILENL
ncbi:MAG: S-ribosylhomocysteine lyase [Clostridiales bacterium]|nr:S-ribosylhomocysteine lyase [Clostridiales bacterium]